MSEDKVREWFDLVTTNIATWKEHGWGGYMKAGSWNPSSRGFPYMQIENPKLSNDEAKEMMKNVTAFLKENNYRCANLNKAKAAECGLEPCTYNSW